ncbi:HU family DNA-binding protein [Gluconobacter albidus]|uniref:HU family DNA-binding protein n=1 Tax=Gluconobacter albidus TaxID=318683 RepID=UPI00309EA837
MLALARFWGTLHRLANRVITGDNHMKTNDIVDLIAVETEVTHAKARQTVDRLIDAILDAAVRGEEVNITGLGKFSVKSRPAHMSRNPRTGERVEVPVRYTLNFASGTAVARKLNPEVPPPNFGKTT